MNTTSGPRNSLKHPLPPWRTVRWYSWAGLVLTIVGAYFAFSGQFRLGDLGELRAASNEQNDVTWKTPSSKINSTAKNKEDGPKLITPSNEPTFRSPGEKQSNSSGITISIPENKVLPKPNGNATHNPQVKKVLDSYSRPPIIPTQHETKGSESPKTDTSNNGLTLPTIQLKNDAKNNNQTAIPVILPEFPQSTSTSSAQPNKSSVQPETIPTSPTPLKKGIEQKVPNLPQKKQYPPYQPENSEDSLLLAAGRAAFQAGKYSEAIERFETYLERNPRDFDIHAEFAGILVTMREIRKAIREYELYLTARPDDITIRVILGDVYVIAKEYRQAIQQFTKVLEKKLAEEQTPEVVKQVLELATRLARAYVFDSDFVRANQVYERYLTRIRPDDPRAPRALGSLLLDLERPGDAMPYLIKQRELHPEDIEILSSLVRALARLGERSKAVEILNEMANKDLKNFGVREVLAEILFDSDEYELSGMTYNQILTLDPKNGGALVGLAAVHIRMYNPNAARRILDSFIPGKDVQRAYLITYASYHETIGEYTEAKQIYKDMLRRNEKDHGVRDHLAYIYDYCREWELAKAEYAKIIPPTASPAMVRKGRFGFATTLFHQRKFAEALEVLRILLSEDPMDHQTVGLMAEVLTKSGAADQAEKLCRGYLANNPRSEYMSLTVRLALGKALLALNKNLEASREYEIALARPIGRIPEAYFGLARASERLGNAARSEELIACVITNSSGGGLLRNIVQLADLSNELYDDHRVVELLSPIAKNDPQNLSILIRLADAQQRIARLTGRPLDCFDTCQQILTLSPTNVRGHLAMARSFAICQNYRKSAVQYDQLIQIDPSFMIPERERARVLYADHQYSAARSQYKAMQSNPNPEQQLQADLLGLISKEPRLRSILGPYTSFDLPADVLRRELPKISLSLATDPESQLAIQRIINDYDARLADVRAFQGEEKAKELKDYRPYEAIPAYQAINLYEPTNTETLFDAGQNYARLKMTKRALEMYSATLAVDPTHREAAVATERANANLAPRFDSGYNYFYQRGRNGLANIDRNRWWLAGAVSLGDEDEYFQAGYAYNLLDPTDDRTLSGNMPFIRAQKRFLDHRLLAFGQLNVEEYPNRVDTRPTFEAGIQYTHTDCLQTRFGGYFQNVLESGESLRQSISRGGVYVGADVRPSRTWIFGGTYLVGSYSDDNTLNQFDLYNEISLTLPPKQLKVVLNYFFQGFSDQSIFPTNPPNPNFVFGTIHPYFSPKAFSFTEARIEWWHYLSRDYFVHSNQCYYSVQYGLGVDDSLVAYQDIRTLFTYEPCSWLTLGAEAKGLFSRVYDSVQANAFVQIRFR
jgi:tetratricopeptide (TPR) repeat protein